MVRLRSTLRHLPSYVPGRKVPGAAPLASNESPYGLLPAVAARLAEFAAGTSRYPDMGAVALIDAIAGHHGISPDQVAVGAGSSEVCGQLLHSVIDTVDDDDEVVFGWRSFEAYPLLTAVAGGSAVGVDLRDHTLDLDAMADAVTERTKLVFLCNPNNPTSTAVGEPELRKFVAAVPEHVLIVVDEAYREYVDQNAIPDALTLFGDQPNVVVLRTFSKAYALAGLRVGYCVGAPEIISHVRKTQVPFSVSSLAQQAAVTALQETHEVERRVRLTVAERDRVATHLLQAGYDIPLSQTNFVWLPLGDQSIGFAKHCLAGGVAARPFAGDGVRVTIGLPEENDVFLTLAAEWPR
jgi:histidinol-phosphate aminotransferase